MGNSDTKGWANRRIVYSVVAIVSFAMGAGRCSAQDNSHPRPKSPIDQITPAKQPPFDRLELMSFVVGTFYKPSIWIEVQRRGINFVPDSEFLKLVESWQSSPHLAEMIKGAKRQPGSNTSPQREAAYEILLVAIDHMKKREFVSSDQEYRHALELAPESATLHLAHCAQLVAVPELSRAEAECRRSLQLWPDDSEAHTILATSLIGQGRNREAISEAREALRLIPGHQAALVALAMALERDQQYEEAISVLRDALSQMPYYDLLHKELGSALLHSGELDESIAQLNLFVQKLPSDADGHYQLGVALRAKGRQAEANNEFKEAARLDPNNSVYATLVNPEEAQKSAESDCAKLKRNSISGGVYTNSFFGFVYQIPEGSKVMGTESAKGLAELVGEMLPKSNPVMADAQNAGVRTACYLLFAVRGSSGQGVLSFQSIQIVAMKLDPKGGAVSAEGLTRGVVNLMGHPGRVGEALGPAEKVEIGNRVFWKINFAVTVNNANQNVAEFVMVRDDFALLFVFSAADAAGRDELAKTMESVKFDDTP